MQIGDQRYDVSDEVWALIEPYLPGREGSWGGVAQDNRQFVSGVFWVLRNAALWRELPAEYGDWQNLHRRFCRWREKGVWEKVLEQVMEDPDYEWLLSTQDREARFAWPWMRMICRSDYLLAEMPGRVARR